MPPCKDSGTNFKQAKCGLDARSTHHGAIFLKFESEKIGICLKKIRISCIISQKLLQISVQIRVKIYLSSIAP